MNAPAKPRFALPPLDESLGVAYRLRPARGPAAGLVLLLHGVGSNESMLAGLAAMLPENLHIALLRSPLSMGPGAYSWFAVNFTADGPRINATEAENSRQRLSAFVTALQHQLDVPPQRTLIAGFSQGGIMSASLALTRPQQVAGFAILSGRILPEIQPLIAPNAALAHLAVLIAHGDADQTLPVSWAERSLTLVQGLDLQPLSHIYPDVGHTITAQMAADFSQWVRQTLAPAQD